MRHITNALGSYFCMFAKAKVSEFNMSILIQENVIWFKISVNIIKAMHLSYS